MTNTNYFRSYKSQLYCIVLDFSIKTNLLLGPLLSVPKVVFLV